MTFQANKCRFECPNFKIEMIGIICTIKANDMDVLVKLHKFNKNLTEFYGKDQFCNKCLE